MINDRQQQLKNYILACIRDCGLTWHDFLSNPDRFLKLLSKDVRIVLKDAGYEGGVNLLRMGAMLLSGFAEKIAIGKRR